MARFYIPATMDIKVNGRPHHLDRGIQELPDEVANHAPNPMPRLARGQRREPSANELGIKPVEEMTAAEYRSLGLPVPPPVVPVFVEPPASVDGSDALDIVTKTLADADKIG